MGLCFRKSINLGHGIKINLSKSGPSISFGKTGLRQTISATGKSTTSVGIPGTGVYYKKQINVKNAGKSLINKIIHKDSDRDEESEVNNSVIKTKGNDSKDNDKVLEYENYVNSIVTIHQTCDDIIDWDGINSSDVPSGYKKGSEEYENWEKLHELAGKVLDGDIDSYLSVIELMQPFDDLLEFGSDFEFGTDKSGEMSVEFCVKSNEVVPTNVITLLASGKVSDKEMAKTKYNELVQDYICSTTIRVARDLFALLPIDRAVIHAVDKMLNTATGNEEDVTILSVIIDRNELEKINMDKIDPSDALNAMKCNMIFSKTNGFKEVERLS